MEIVDMYLGKSKDKGLFEYFCQDRSHFFPTLRQMYRTTFVRQGAKLWAIKERLWCTLRDERLSYDPVTTIIDSFPMPVCHFAKAYRCSHFKGEAGFGKDHTACQAFYGFRVHARLCWPGVITQVELVAASVHEGEVAYDLTKDTLGLLLADRNYWLPALKADLRGVEIVLLMPFRTAKHAPPQCWSPVLGRVCYRVEVVFRQLVERCGAKRVWACDLWHQHNRLLHMILMHTFSVFLNIQADASPLQLERLVSL